MPDVGTISGEVKCKRSYGRRPWTADDRAELKELLQRGLTYRAIEKITGRHYGSIAGIIRRMGLHKPRGPRKTAAPFSQPGRRAPSSPLLRALFVNPADMRFGR